MAKRISESRKTAFYIGSTIQVCGFLLFISVFVTAAMNFGDFSNFEEDARSSMYRGIGGMVLLIVGGLVRQVGARGLAGSGIVLNPDRARGEMEPYSRMAGGMVKDALDEADIDLGRSGSTPAKVVMIRCSSCRKLNEEDSKFCQECGAKI